MRKLIVSEFVSLDGVIQAPGGQDEDRDGGFEHGGWTLPYWHDDIGRTFLTLMRDVDALLLGRRTYVIHAEASLAVPAIAPVEPDCAYEWNGHRISPATIIDRSRRTIMPSLMKPQLATLPPAWPDA